MGGSLFFLVLKKGPLLILKNLIAPLPEIWTFHSIQHLLTSSSWALEAGGGRSSVRVECHHSWGLCYPWGLHHPTSILLLLIPPPLFLPHCSPTCLCQTNQSSSLPPSGSQVPRVSEYNLPSTLMTMTWEASAGGEGRQIHPSCRKDTSPISGAKAGKIFPVEFLEASTFGKKKIHKKLQMRVVYVLFV